MELTSDAYSLTRFLFQRLLAGLYLTGFLIAAFQFVGLCGRHGLLPVQLFLKRTSFWQSPSLFWVNHSDTALLVLAWAGVALSLFALSGLSEMSGTWLSVLTWFSLWLLYLSFVNVGQTFYGFGWEMLLLETGFLAIFLGAARAAPSVLIFFLLRWVLFRNMFGAGLIKVRGDSCWRDLTCLQFHYETQPMPGPWSWYFHHLPSWAHKAGVLYNHFVELIVPFAYFGPRPFRLAAALLTILFQGTLILSGNLSWLNVITIVLCVACLDDQFLSPLAGTYATWTASAGAAWALSPWLLIPLTGFLLFLSYKPTRNLLSGGQLMNASFDPLHLVNTYGAFGSITRDRDELIIEGTDEPYVSSTTRWREYEFKGKPGPVQRRPPQVTPYHYKLDWQMWFAAMSPYYYHPWILNLVAKLLANDAGALALLRGNPFPEHAPTYVRVRQYRYRFTPRGSSDYWERTLTGEYLPALALDDPAFRAVLEQQGWRGNSAAGEAR